MDKTITVKTEGGDVVVRKLALQDYGELLKALKKLPAELGQLFDKTDDSELKNMDFKALLPRLPEMLGDAVPEFAQILSIPTDKDAQFFLQGDLADAIDVFAAMTELNDYSRVAAAVKKLMARKPAAPATPPAA